MTVYEFYDCDENCLSDTDGDGVCDELEAFDARQHRVQLRCKQRTR